MLVQTMPCTPYFYGSFNIAYSLAFLDPCISLAGHVLERYHSKNSTLCSHHDCLSNAQEGKKFHFCGFAAGCNVAVHVPH